MGARLGRWNRDPQGLSDLGQREPFDVMQNDHGPIARRQFRDCRAQHDAKLCLHRRIVDV